MVFRWVPVMRVGAGRSVHIRERRRHRVVEPAHLAPVRARQGVILQLLDEARVTHDGRQEH